MKMVATSSAQDARCPVCGHGFCSGNYVPKRRVQNPGTPMETITLGPDFELVEAHCACGYHFERQEEKSELERLREEVKELKRLVEGRLTPIGGAPLGSQTYTTFEPISY
jgi:hypothetical protein